MILKKPYAFFIKYFKLIHLLLTFFSGVIASYFYKNYRFFSTYISNGYRATSTYQLIETYLPFYVFIILFFVIVLLFVCILLLKYKNKPYLLYLLEIIYIILILGVLIYVRYLLGVLTESLIEATLSRTIRDIMLILLLPFPFFLVATFLRTFGFNIKQFEFNNDIKQMNVGLADSEEIEISFGNEMYRYKRKIHKYFRELKYYILENKLYVIIIGIALFLFLCIFLFTNRTPNYTKNYSQGRKFNFNDVSILVEDSMITNVDYKGQIIKSGKYFLVVRVKVENLANHHNSIDFNTFRITDGKNIIDPSPNYYFKFSDYANNQDGSFIGINGSIEYGIVYEIDESQIHHNFKIKLDNGVVTYKNNVYNKTVYIGLNPKNDSNNIKINNFGINDTIDFKKSIIEGNKLTVTSFDIAKAFNYKYIKNVNNKDKEYMGRVSVGALSDKQDDYIIKIDYTYETFEKSKYKTFNSVITNFGYLKYKIDNNEFEINFENITPNDYNNGIFLEVPNDVINATSIKLIISVRNVKYQITLK